MCELLTFNCVLWLDVFAIDMINAYFTPQSRLIKSLCNWSYLIVLFLTIEMWATYFIMKGITKCL